MLLCGYREAQIAARLRVSRRAVHARLERLHRRFGVHSRVTLAVRVLATLAAACEHACGRPHPLACLAGEPPVHPAITPHPLHASAGQQL